MQIFLFASQGFVQGHPRQKYAFFSRWMLPHGSECCQGGIWRGFTFATVEPFQHLLNHIACPLYGQTLGALAHDRSGSQANRTSPPPKTDRFQQVIVGPDPHFDLIATAWITAAINAVHGFEVTPVTWIVEVIKQYRFVNTIHTLFRRELSCCHEWPKPAPLCPVHCCKN